MKTITIKNKTLGDGIPKICIPLMADNINELFTFKNKVANLNFSLIEIRIDYFTNIFNETKIIEYLKEVRNTFNDKIIIFTLRTKLEGGNINISDDKYKKVNLLALKSNCIDIIDFQVMLEDDIIKTLIKEAHKNNVKVILSYHNFKETPSKDSLTKKIELMEKYQGDIKKIAVVPNKVDDLLNVLSFSSWVKENYSSPNIFISMGKIGVLSRVLGEFFGSCITFGTIENLSSLGQINVSDLNSIMSELHNLYK